LEDFWQAENESIDGLDNLTYCNLKKAYYLSCLAAGVKLISLG